MHSFVNAGRKHDGRLARFLCAAVWLLFLCIMVPLALCALLMTAKASISDNYLNLGFEIVREAILPNAVLTAALMLGFVWIYRMMMKLSAGGMGVIVGLVWMAAAVCFVLAIGLVPRGDSYFVISAAESFAKGDFSPMQSEYFNSYSYQLGICFVLEMLKRMLSCADLNLVAQCLNAVLTVGTFAALAALCGMLLRSAGANLAAFLLCLAFLPDFLYCMFVYGTVPMLFLCACAMLCFAGYTQTRKKRLAFLYAILLGCAMVVKPNALIVMLALLICAVLHAFETGDWTLALFGLLSAVLCAALPSAVVRGYEWRSGVTLGEDITLLARLTMGMQDGETAAGWYNAYVERFWDFGVTVEMEKEQALHDLMLRLEEMRLDPKMARAFFAEKCLTQWVEPGYEILWYGSICTANGRFNGLAHLIFREGRPIRMLLEAYLNAFQQMLYALIVLGAADMLRRRAFRAEQAMIPVTLIGGFLYHMIFEAKSQYGYIYVLLMIPLAAQGMTMLPGKGGRRRETIKISCND